ncbi:MAG: GNAT family N-acetyltransferase [Candidatus Latescibacteria bacterium]|nr:GNAT family N-acetyltransferase [Candidatus Latescibacterota bacterium]
MTDYPALIQLWQQTELSYRPQGRDSYQEIARQTKLPYIHILVALTGREIIGSVFGSHDGRRGWINRLAVHPDYQRKGIAKSLVKAIEKWLDQQGIKIVCSLIEDWNIKSIKFMQIFDYTKHNDIIYFSKRKSHQV